MSATLMLNSKVDALIGHCQYKGGRFFSILQLSLYLLLDLQCPHEPLDTSTHLPPLNVLENYWEVSRLSLEVST